MSSFKEYIEKALNKEKQEIKKIKKIEINENDSSFNKYLKKYKNILLEEEVKDDEYLDSDSEENENTTDDTEENDVDEVLPKDENEDEDDSAEDYEKDEDEEAANSTCPIPTQDQTVNIENRQKAIDEFAYGPEKIEEANDDFWAEKKTKFMVKTVELAKAKLCGNCAAFTIKSAMLTCLDNGIDKTVDENDTWDADKENRGYCDFLDFKCHAQRTCDSWVEGGPLKDAAA